MANILYNILEHFSIIKCLLCITTDNRIMQKELEESLNNLDINNSWSSKSTKIPRLAHMIQLVVKAILGTFNIKPAENGHSDESIDDRGVNSVITKVWYQE
jgi:hypothetical protein